MFFEAVPIRDPYKEVNPECIVLLSQPSIIRVCVIVEAVVVIIVFFLSYYYTAITGTEVTKISYQILDGYFCTVLIPRSDSEAFSTESSEFGAFSAVRYTLEECMTALGPNGFDVCSDDRRQDFLIQVNRIETNDDVCADLVLPNNYRLCVSREETLMVAPDPSSVIVFEDAVDSAYTPLLETTTQYFTNQTGVYRLIDTQYNQSDLLDSLLTDYVSDLRGNVYFAALHDSSASLFVLSPDLSTPQRLMDLSDVAEVHGFACTSDSVYVYSIAPSSDQGRVYHYNLTTSQSTVADNVVDCSDYAVPHDRARGTVHLLSVGSDSHLYLTCTDRLLDDSDQTVTLLIARVSPHTFHVSHFLVLDVDALLSLSPETSLVTHVPQVFQMLGEDGDLFLLTGPSPRYLIQAHLAAAAAASILPSRNNLTALFLSNFTIETVVAGEVAVPLDDRRLYLTGSGRNAYDLLERSWATAFPSPPSSSSSLPGDFLTRGQVGYSYQVCGEENTTFLIDKSIATSFSQQCQRPGGLYYQRSAFLSLPVSCSSIAAPNWSTLLTSCPALAQQYGDYVRETCPLSMRKVCDAAYTFHPPFSCEKTVYPSWWSVLATALANASAAWGFICLVLRGVLRWKHPHYTREFDYDVQRERYLDKRGQKVYISAGEGGREERGEQALAVETGMGSFRQTPG